MRIRSVSIRSFGSLRDRSYGVSEGMTVFHGPNESGKTTVMEFIRTCLVPSNKRNQYPAREKTDSGTLVYEQDGEERTLRLIQKTVGGDRPRMPTGTDDPSLFRSVFAMTSADLDDEKVVTEGGIRSRFLTVPGGDAMPSARAAAEEVWSKTLGKRSNSSSRVIALESESSALDAEISQASALTDSYGQLDRQRSELSVRLSALQEESRSSAAAKTVHDVYVSNTGNYGRLRSLSEEREALGEFVTVTAEDEAEMARLRAESAQRQTALKELQERRSSEEADLMGADRRKVAARSAAIESLPGKLQAYREDSRRLRSLDTGAPRPPRPLPSPAPEKRRIGALFAAGVLLTVLGVIAALFVHPYAIALSVVGLIAAAIGSRRPAEAPRTERSDEHDGADTEAESIRQRMSSFEDEVLGIISDIGAESLGIEDDVAYLTKARDAAVSLSKLDNDIMRARMEQGEANTRFLSFTQRFSGEEGFAANLAKTRRAAEIDRERDVIRSAISEAGLDPDNPDCPVEYDGDPAGEEMGEVRQRIGAIEERMRAILDTDELERMMDRRALLESEMHSALDEGAVGLLACAIADSACEEIYSQVQPGVIATADRYLSMMTDGRYRIDTDPRSKDLSIRSGDETKGIGAWSSGLRAQVLLSVKLAVAKEMGGGEVPVILDDVLLPFDSERKAGACRALAELSSEMQVLMFTCDAETAEICRSLEGVETVGMTVS